jgi:hypothetical protein
VPEKCIIHRWNRFVTVTRGIFGLDLLHDIQLCRLKIAVSVSYTARVSVNLMIQDIVR